MLRGCVALFLLLASRPSPVRAQYAACAVCTVNTTSCGSQPSSTQCSASIYTSAQCQSFLSSIQCAVVSCPGACGTCTAQTGAKYCQGAGGGSGSGGGSSGGPSGPAEPTPLIPVDPTGYRSPGVQRLGGGMFDFGATNPIGSFQGEAEFTSHYASSFADWAEEAEERSKKDDEAAVKELMETYGADYSAFNKMCAEYPQTCSLVCSAIDCSEGDPRTNLAFLSTEGVLPSPYGNPAGIFNAAGDPMPPPNSTAAYEYKYLGRVANASEATPRLAGTTPTLQDKNPVGKTPSVPETKAGSATATDPATATASGASKTATVPLLSAPTSTPGTAPGAPVTTIAYNKAISIEGTAEFQKKVTSDLNKISTTKSGVALYKSLEASGMSVTVKSAEGKDNETYGNSSSASDAEIVYNPDRVSLKGPPPDPYKDAKWAQPPNRPPDIGLFHELVHADDFMNGTMDASWGVNVGKLAGQPVRTAELRAVGLIGSYEYTENTYRKERGVIDRDFY